MILMQNMMNIIHPNCSREKIEILLYWLNPNRHIMATQDTCYICYDQQSDENLFVDPNPCDCKGTIKIHNSCLQELMNQTNSCGVCKKIWQINGTKQLFYPDGQLKEEKHYINGLMEGLYKEYHENGQLYIIMNYHNGKKEGLYNQYYDNGQLHAETYYENNMKNGYYKSYYGNGQIRMDCTYVNDIYMGQYKYYYENGQLKEEKNYINGFREGCFKYYYDNGQLQEKRYYENDNLVKNNSYRINEPNILSRTISKFRKYIANMLQ